MQPKALANVVSIVLKHITPRGKLICFTIIVSKISWSRNETNHVNQITHVLKQLEQKLLLLPVCENVLVSPIENKWVEGNVAGDKTTRDAVGEQI